jgi:hypothetical protein
MKTKKPNAELVWKQIVDHLVPRLRLSVTDRVVYWHLLRYSRLEGKTRLRFSIQWLARGIGLCHNSTRWAVRRLVSRGVLRLLQCSKAGHVLEVLLPDEIRAASADKADGIGQRVLPSFPPAIYSEGVDFLKTAALRKSIYARNVAVAFIACVSLRPRLAALTTSCPSPSSAAILTATWSPAVCNAIPKKENAPPWTFSAGFTVSAA